MFKLRLLGTPHLEGPNGTTSTGPRRIALLASLAAAGPGGLTRDKLVARLWEESDGERARRNLSQLLYSMRGEFGADLVEGTGTLRIDPQVCWTDVGAFDAAVTERREPEALAIYGGAFLDGFHLSDAPEFTRWAESERQRREVEVRTLAVRVAESVPAADSAGRVAAWRRAAALDPVDERVAQRLIDALVAAGDRIGALRAAEQHAAIVRAEFEREPSSAIQRRVDELRRASGPTATPAPSQPAGAGGNRSEAARPDTAGGNAAAAGAAGTADGSADRGAPHAAAPSHGSDGVPGPAGSGGSEGSGAGRAVAGHIRDPGARRRWFAAGGLVVAAAVALIAWSSRAPARIADDEFVIVAEFVNHTSDTMLTRTIGVAVGAALQQSAHVVPLPRSRVAAALRRMDRPDTQARLDLTTAREIAQREGVRFVLEGEVLEAEGRFQLVSRIVAAPSGATVRARTFAVESRGGLFDAVDELAAAFRRDLGEARATVAKARPLPDVTTRSLDALHHYAAASDASWRGEHALANDLLERAVAIDSNFSMALALLGQNALSNNDVPKAREYFRRALADDARLSVEERLRVGVMRAYGEGDLGGAIELSERLLALRPRDVASWARLGFYYFASGRNREARAAYAKADSIEPLSVQNLLNVGTSWLSTARYEQQPAAFDSARAWYHRAFAIRPAAEYEFFYNQQYGSILIGLGLVDSARATFARMAQRSPGDRARAERSLGFLEAMAGRWTVSAAHFADAAELSTAQRQWTSALRNEALLADILLTSGRSAEARAPIARAAAIALREPIEPRAVAFVAQAAAKAGDLVTARRLLARMRASLRPLHDGEAAAALGVEAAIALASGEGVRALELTDQAVLRDSSNFQVLVTRARAAAAAARDSLADAIWSRIVSRIEFGLEGQFDAQLGDADRGAILERLGRREEALTVLRALVRAYPRETVEPPALAEARARLQRIETTQRR